MSYAASLFVLLAVLSFMQALTGKRNLEKNKVKQRLMRVGEVDLSSDIRQAELKAPFSERALKPVFNKLTGVLTYILPNSILKNLESKLQKAGNPGNITANELFTIKFLSAAVLSIPLFFLLELSILVIALMAILGWNIPELFLRSHIRKKKDEIEKTLPDILDLLTVSVEAGLGFDGALSKVVEKTRGILADEFKRVIKENRMGKNRKEALKDMAERLGSEDLTSFIGAIIQADQLGISFSNVLRTQSTFIRQKRKQRVEEAAMKAPIKIIIPLVLFIFPVLFIILLGPALINIFETLG